MSLPSLVLEDINNDAYPEFRAKNFDILKAHFICPYCKTLMNANMKIFQCIDGHIICENCKDKTQVFRIKILKIDYVTPSQKCLDCDLNLSGRNYTMERIAKILFDTGDQQPTAPEDQVDQQDQQNHPTAPDQVDEDKINLTDVSDSSV